MATTKKTLDKYLVELRRISEHRTVGAEKNIKRIYKNILAELQNFLATEYRQYAEDDSLSYEILQRNGQYATFLRTVQERLDGITPEVSKEITNTVEKTYEYCYNGMVDAVRKSTNAKELAFMFSSIAAVTPEVVKAAVENPVKGLTLSNTLEKYRSNIVYNIKQTISVGLSQGDRYSTMAKRIAETLDGDYTKAIRIVRTEAHRNISKGLQDAADDIDNTLKENDSDIVMVKIWRCMHDSRVRKTHDSLDGQMVLNDEEFKSRSGATAKEPCGFGKAAEDINCRCFLEYDMMTRADYYKKTGKKVEPPKAKEKKKATQPQEQKPLTTTERIKEVTTKLSTNGVQVGKMTGIDKDLTADSLEQINGIINKYPKLKDYLAKGNLNIKSAKTNSIGSYVSSRNYGTGAMGEHTIKLSTNYLDDMGKYIKSQKEQIANHWKMPVSEVNLGRYTATHEMGHCIENMILNEHIQDNQIEYREMVQQAIYERNPVKYINRWYKKFKDDIRKEIVANARKKDRKMKVTELVSDYGKTNSDEFFAEIFAHSQLADSDQMNVLGQAMLEWLEERLK